jgi:NDP-sugar pyrophosphorylase family protein
VVKALILAGGLGTRLRGVISDSPKSMAQAGGRPFLAYLIEHLCAQGFREIVLCLGYLADQVQSCFGDGQAWGVDVTYSVETELLGTAGAIRHAGHLIDGAFLVLNGDSYHEVDYRGVVRAHRRARADDARLVGSIAATRVANASAFGALLLSDDFRVRAFQEKARSAKGWANAGAYVLEPQVLDWIPAGQAVSLERQTFPLLLQEGLHLRASPLEGFFVDIGTAEGYERFRQHVEEPT